ncbi:MAG: copper resistance protein B [Chromatocurvus sp.]
MTMTMRKRFVLLFLAMEGLTIPSVWAQGTQTEDPHVGHSMSPPATPVDRDKGAAEREGDMSGMNGMSGMDMGSMQGGSPPPDARDPHAYSGGYEFGPDRLRLADAHSMGSLLMDRFEAVRSDGNTSVTYDLQAWYGRTYDRVVLKAEGEIDDGGDKETSTELLWGHAVATFWDTQLGLRYDSGEGPDRTWLAFGMQGLAPYWFEIDATAYLGEQGRSALNLEVEYELLLTQKWILQPRVEADFHGKNDRERGIGSGLSVATAGVRLRYEIRREFAPYLGIEWAGKFGGTKDLARANGEDTHETRLVAGLHFWF